MLFWGVSAFSPKFPFLLSYSLMASFERHVLRIIFMTEQFPAVLALLQFWKL